jgi:hypothetical protein
MTAAGLTLSRLNVVRLPSRRSKGARRNLILGPDGHPGGAAYLLDAPTHGPVRLMPQARTLRCGACSFSTFS